MNLREYQFDALTAVRTAYHNSIYRQAIVMSTGLGKSVVMANLIETMKDVLPKKMLVVAHREELLQQNAAHIRIWNPALKVDIEQAEQHADLNADVVVASVATLGRANSARASRFDWESFDKIVIDELHHSTAQTYRNVLEVSGALNPDKRKLLVGLSATPNRTDGEDLSDIYERIVYQFGLREAIEAGWLVDIRGHRVRTETNLDVVKTSNGDFQQDSLASTVDTPERNKTAVEAWLKVGREAASTQSYNKSCELCK